MTETISASNVAAQAFLLMELAPISSLSDDSPQMIDAARMMPQAIDLLLEACDWGFASTLVALPEAAALPAPLADDPDLPHVYTLPGSIAALRQVGGLHTRWRRDAGYLRASDPGPLPLRYTRRIESETEMPAAFRTALAYQLAVLMAPRWLGSQTKRDQLQREFDAVLRRAMRNDAATASPQPWSGGATGSWVAEAVR